MISSRDLGIFRRLLRHARPCWPHLAAIFLLQLIAAPNALLGPVTLKIAADNAIGQQPLPWYLAWMAPDGFSPLAAALFVMTVFALSVALLSHIQGVASWILQTYTGERLVLEFRSEAFAHAQRLSLGYHDERGSADSEHRRFARQGSLRMWSQVKLASTQASFHLLIGLTMAVGMAAALLMGVQHVRSGSLTMGQLWMVMTYMGMLYGPLSTLSSKLPEMQAWMASVERVFALLDKAPRIADKPNAISIDHTRGDICFEGVSFGYRADETIVRDVSFDIPAGTRVGVVGTTGSGKTTLITLLGRFYDPSNGRILLDGVDLRDYK